MRWAREVEPGAVRGERIGERVDARGWGRSRTRAGPARHAPSAASAARRSCSARRARRAEVGLGDDEHVGHLHDPRLQELQRIAAARLDDDRDGVRGLGDVGLGLADADGLDHDDVEGVGERLGGRAGGRGEAAEALARGHRADEDVAVGRVVLDPRAVAEQRAAGALGGGVDGEHGDAALARAPLAQQRGEQRRLADAGRAGDADDVARALTRGGDERGRLGPRGRASRAG